MDPLKILEIMAQRGGQPAPAVPNQSAEAEKPEKSDVEKMIDDLKAQMEKQQRPVGGGAQMLNPFYNPNAPGINGDTLQKVGAAMGGK